MTTRSQRRSGMIRFLIGPPDEPFHQIHNAFLLIASLFFGSAVIINRLFELTPWYFDFILVALIPIVLGLWGWSRFGNGFQPAGIIFSVLLALVVLPMAWFANGGINGPALLFYLSVLFYVAGMLQGQRSVAWVTLGIICLSPIILIALQHHFPQLVHAYPSVAQRMIDMSLSYALVVVLIGFLVIGHFRRFNEELRLSHRYAAQLQHLADHDGLTGLLNHRAILEMAAQAHQRDQLEGLLFCDLDRFKNLNDQYGHPYGDTVLRAFSRILDNASAKFAIHCARYGGEEFLILNSDPRLEIQWIDDYLRQQTAMLVLPHGPITFSSGGTGVAGADNDSVNNALKRADQALYQAKHEGRNRLVIHDGRLQAAPTSTLQELLYE